jgi:hypothetical protein
MAEAENAVEPMRVLGYISLWGYREDNLMRQFGLNRRQLDSIVEGLAG